MTTAKRPNPAAVIRVVVALVGVGSLLLTAQGAVQATERGVAVLNDREHALGSLRRHVDYETLWRQFVTQVPPGSRVSVTPAPFDTELWHQRLTEFAVLHGCVVVVRGAEHDYAVGLERVQRTRPADPSVRLVVRRVG
ncbi:hypothetical protein O7634_13730 [Micromonospora sp. WMMD1120]|uniref:hypothetical protein n=1 Tax=Micromonospora sp. WMMD1120 TaxID=3016106 RepID=UPI002417420B|nr:hypothetical protein [Micromonospora sp. WMMD1120]MDG4807810.1 hypothetical protein [Micromonospora sp. WMMD1120]